MKRIAKAPNCNFSCQLWELDDAAAPGGDINTVNRYTDTLIWGLCLDIFSIAYRVYAAWGRHLSLGSPRKRRLINAPFGYCGLRPWICSFHTSSGKVAKWWRLTLVYLCPNDFQIKMHN